MSGLPTYANPAEAPDWQRELVGVATVWHGPHHPVRRPVYRVPAPSRPHPWPESKQMPPSDDFTKHFIEQQ